MNLADDAGNIGCRARPFTRVEVEVTDFRVPPLGAASLMHGIQRFESHLTRGIASLGHSPGLRPGRDDLQLLPRYQPASSERRKLDAGGLASPT